MWGVCSASLRLLLFYGILSYRSAVALQTLATMDCHILSLSLSLSLLTSICCCSYYSIHILFLCLPLALQPGILLPVKLCSYIFPLLFMGDYPIFFYLFTCCFFPFFIGVFLSSLFYSSVLPPVYLQWLGTSWCKSEIVIRCWVGEIEMYGWSDHPWA